MSTSRWALLWGLLGRDRQTYELYVRGPRAEILGALAQMGQVGREDRFALRWARAVAWVGPTGAVVSVPAGASDEDARALFGAIGEVARRHGWSLADPSGERIPSEPDAMLERFRSAGAAAPGRAGPKKKLSVSQAYLLFLIIAVVLAGVGIAILRFAVKAFIHAYFGTL